MIKNLTEKINIIVEDSETFGRDVLIHKLKELIESELRFSESEHIITQKDLNLIHSHAITTFNSSNVSAIIYDRQAYTDEKLARTYCFMEAVVGFLRSKNLIHFTLKVKSEEKRRR